MRRWPQPDVSTEGRYLIYLTHGISIPLVYLAPRYTYPLGIPTPPRYLPPVGPRARDTYPTEGTWDQR